MFTPTRRISRRGSILISIPSSSMSLPLLPQPTTDHSITRSLRSITMTLIVLIIASPTLGRIKRSLAGPWHAYCVNSALKAGPLDSSVARRVSQKDFFLREIMRDNHLHDRAHCVIFQDLQDHGKIIHACSNQCSCDRCHGRLCHHHHM